MMVKDVIKNLDALTDDQKKAVADLVQLAMWAVDPKMNGAFIQGFDVLVEPLGLKVNRGNITHLTVTDLSLHSIVSESDPVSDLFVMANKDAIKDSIKKASANNLGVAYVQVIDNKIVQAWGKDETPIVGEPTRLEILAKEYECLSAANLREHYLAVKAALMNSLKEDDNG